jgi:plasmid stability protein
MKRTTITLPDELDSALRREAERYSTSVSEVARILLVKGLTGSEEHPREIPWAGLFHDSEMVPAERLDEALEGWADTVDRDRG